MESQRDEINRLRSELEAKEQRLRDLEAKFIQNSGGVLSNDEIERYSRQLILKDFGVSTQMKLKRSAILIVGIGGLGCPAAQYLVAAGCGRIGLVDYDEVEIGNLHRQTLHTEARLGRPKVESAREALLATNPHCQLDVHQLLLNSDNALELLTPYNVVIDCTDNVPTRYLLNDACVLLHKSLVSGSALQLDGQLTVYHYGEEGPCYRCLFPVPPPPETVTNCGDGGILGAVTGVIGSLQALEAIKVVGELGDVLSGRLLIFDGARCIFRNIKLRPRRQDCDICSTTPMITHLINYEQFCKTPSSDKDCALALLSQEQRVSVSQYQQLQKMPHLLIDVRLPSEFEICRLPGAVNIPLRQLLDDTYGEHFASVMADEAKVSEVVVVCRRGNDSQIAVQHLKNKFPLRVIRDIVGGLHAWHYQVDMSFPIY